MSETFKNCFEWIKIKISDIGELLRGINYKKEEAINEPKEKYLPILRANNISASLNFNDLVYVPQKNVKEEQLIKKGDIIFAMSSGSKQLVGKSAQAIFDYHGSYGAFCSLLRPCEKINKKFVAFFFQSPSYKNLISQIAKGTNINNLKREHILDFEFPFPPLPEQNAIVTKLEALLSELDKGIDLFKTVQQQLKIYRQSLLKYAFEGKLTEEWRKKKISKLQFAEKLIEQIKIEREKHYKQQLSDYNSGKIIIKPKPPKEIAPLTNSELIELPELPKEWSWRKIIDTVFNTSDDIVDGPFGSNLKNSDYSDAGTVPVIGISNIDEGYKTKIRYVTIDKFNTISRSAVYPGDIVIAKIGSSYGKTGIYPEWMPIGLIPANLIRIRPANHFHKKLLIYYLKSRTFKKELEKIVKSTAQPAYNVSDFKELPIPFLSLVEQHQIVSELESRLSLIDKLEEIISDGLIKSEIIRHSILKKAFEGKLLSEKELSETRKDPDWEPAEKLLERIKKLNQPIINKK